LFVLAVVLVAAGCGASSHNSVGAPTTRSVAPTTSGTEMLVLRCVARPPQSVSSGQVPGSASTFVPGRPQRLLACRYHGFNQRQPAGSLAATAQLRAEPIASALNRAPHIPKGVVFSCPFDAAEVIVLHFGYANGAVLTITVSTQGCRIASNGDLRVRTPESVLNMLQARLGRDPL